MLLPVVRDQRHGEQCNNEHRHCDNYCAKYHHLARFLLQTLNRALDSICLSFVGSALIQIKSPQVKTENSWTESPEP